MSTAAFLSRVPPNFFSPKRHYWQTAWTLHQGQGLHNFEAKNSPEQLFMSWYVVLYCPHHHRTRRRSSIQYMWVIFFPNQTLTVEPELSYQGYQNRKNRNSSGWSEQSTVKHLPSHSLKTHTCIFVFQEFAMGAPISAYYNHLGCFIVGLALFYFSKCRTFAS